MRFGKRCLHAVGLACVLLSCTTPPADSRILSDRGGGNAGSGAASGGGGAPPVNVSTGGVPSIVTPDGGVGELGGTGGALLPGEIPPDFTKADIGGWKLGEPIADTASGGAGGSGGAGPLTSCGTRILAVLRDFPASYPDFEDYVNGGEGVRGIVQQQLGLDQKPGHAVVAGEDAPNATDFAGWYSSS